MIELKTVVKWVDAPLMAKKLNCSSAVNEDFNILMTFENEEDDQELVSLCDSSLLRSAMPSTSS